MSFAPDVDVLPLALADAYESSLYLDAERPSAGERFFAAFEASTYDISRFPSAGAVVETPNVRLRDCRSWPVKGFSNWRICYRIAGERIQIVRVLHAARRMDDVE